MYETDYETRASTYRTGYETRAIMYETDYETRASTYRTGYETRAIMYETDYETRASTYRTGYEARASTYRTDYETRAIMYETGYETQATTYRTDLADAVDTCAYLQTQHAAVVASVGCSCLIGPQVTRLTALRRLGDPQCMDGEASNMHPSTLWPSFQMIGKCFQASVTVRCAAKSHQSNPLRLDGGVTVSGLQSLGSSGEAVQLGWELKRFSCSAPNVYTVMCVGGSEAPGGYKAEENSLRQPQSSPRAQRGLEPLAWTVVYLEHHSDDNSTHTTQLGDGAGDKETGREKSPQLAVSMPHGGRGWLTPQKSHSLATVPLFLILPNDVK
ncbi:hypothetical protein MG293_014283 [Ovis ammon polii]|uniref:Uncharacterized protein n=1 Tax=Ovis ammon polii TaxID=230172 RepID=A0AAD4TYY8_OVIAM|nr:hypothetical protein MG293_014283 [Ovis ammon polii]